MNSIQKQMHVQQPFEMMDHYYTNGHHLQQHYLHKQQQIELERIRLVQQQAEIQQQKALFQMMYYNQQQEQQFMLNNHMQEQPTSPPSLVGDKEQRRAEHNAIERARRESLNTKFQQLAHSLPNLHNDRRPSKGTIIERTLEYVKLTVEKEENLKTEIEQLRLANESLISKMTTDVIEELDEEEEEEEYDDEDEEEEDGSVTPEDTFSEHSVSSNGSSNHFYYNPNQQDFHHLVFEKFQQNSSLLLNKEPTFF
ncbi:hypothetical protein BD770DRAFT_381916 [Pilaira anomala]|nr:hypothetical protein BD770DRAFT_381916 [Pilaira anomala]